MVAVGGGWWWGVVGGGLAADLAHDPRHSIRHVKLRGWQAVGSEGSEGSSIALGEKAATTETACSPMFKREKSEQAAEGNSIQRGGIL